MRQWASDAGNGLGGWRGRRRRARAEGLGLEMKSGLMARPERVVLLSAGLILGGEAWLVWTLAILAATSVITSVQRILTVWRKLARANEHGRASDRNARSSGPEMLKASRADDAAGTVGAVGASHGSPE